MRVSRPGSVRSFGQCSHDGLFWGLSAFYHDSAAALVIDGRIVGRRPGRALHARKKHDSAFRNRRSTIVCAKREFRRRTWTSWDSTEKPLLKFERLLETYLAVAPAGLFSFLRRCRNG